MKQHHLIEKKLIINNSSIKSFKSIKSKINTLLMCLVMSIIIVLLFSKIYNDLSKQSNINNINVRALIEEPKENYKEYSSKFKRITNKAKYSLSKIKVSKQTNNSNIAKTLGKNNLVKNDNYLYNILFNFCYRSDEILNNIFSSYDKIPLSYEDFYNTNGISLFSLFQNKNNVYNNLSLHCLSNANALITIHKNDLIVDRNKRLSNKYQKYQINTNLSILEISNICIIDQEANNDLEEIFKNNCIDVTNTKMNISISLIKMTFIKSKIFSEHLIKINTFSLFDSESKEFFHNNYSLNINKDNSINIRYLLPNTYKNLVFNNINNINAKERDQYDCLGLKLEKIMNKSNLIKSNFCFK